MAVEKTFSENKFHPSRIVAEAKNLIIDLKYGSSLLGTIKSSKQGHTWVSNTDYSVHEWAVKSMVDILKPGAKVVDIGCGKGRALNGLHYYAKQRGIDNLKIIGLEYEQEIVEWTKKRLERNKDIEVFYGDVTKTIPEDADVFFMANPFSSDEITEAFIKLINELYFDKNKDVTILYYCPRKRPVFENSGLFDIELLEKPGLVPWKVSEVYRQMLKMTKRK